MKKDKYALYKCGYVNEDLTEVEEKFIQYFYSYKQAETFLNAHISMTTESKSNYFIVKITWNLVHGWTQIEGTEKHF